MTWIYFALVDDGKQVKIGKANDVEARLQQHAKGTLSVHKIELLAAVEGSPVDEAQVQWFFDDFAIEELRPRNNGAPENFYPTPKVTNYIRWLRTQWYTLTDTKKYPEGRVTFDAWRPNEDRQIPPLSTPSDWMSGLSFEPDYLTFPTPVITGDDYYTNPTVISCALEAMGGIDLDPASHPLANKVVKATKFYSIHDDGLKQRWEGRVWLNPPFSQWQEWVPKIIGEVDSGRVQVICVYCAMRTITAQYFRQLLDASLVMCVITGRMKHGGNGGDSPNDGHCVFYIGPDIGRFVKAFKTIGSVWDKPQINT